MPKPQRKINVKPKAGDWLIYPDMLQNGRFRGFQDRDDASQLRGAFVVGQNVKMSGNTLPTIRDGYSAIGTEAVNATPVKRAWVFRRRDDVQIELKAYGTLLVAWVEGVSTEYATLKASFTSGKEFGFGNIGQTDQDFTWSFFCNGEENPFRWTGAYGQYASDDTVNEITVSGSVTLANLGFTATGSIIIGGVEITYTGLTAQTFTGCSAVPAGPTVGDIIFQTPVELTGVVGGGTDPGKFNVAMSHDSRLHIREAAKKSVWDYSKLDDPDDFATGSTDTDGGTKDVEFGGPITAFANLNNTILCFKRNIIKTLDFIQHGSRVDSPRYTTLVSGDDKSTSIGAVNQKSTFSTPFGVVFVTPDKQVLLLTGVTNNGQPQYLVISDPIRPILENGVHDEATGICVDNVLWYAFKENAQSTANDVVIRGDMTKRTVDSDGKVLPILWDAPYIGWNVNDWTALYNSTTKKNEVHWHSSLNSNTYKVTPESKTDNPQEGNDGDFTATIRSWAEHFGVPNKQKRIDAAYVEIRMSENSEPTVAILYDEDGVTQQVEQTLDGDDTDKKFSSVIYNPFGASAFGSQKLGSNASINDLPLYRFDLEINPNEDFFNISLQISTNSAGENWELVRFGFRLAEVAEFNDPKFLNTP